MADLQIQENRTSVDLRRMRTDSLHCVCDVAARLARQASEFVMTQEQVSAIHDLRMLEYRDPCRILTAQEWIEDPMLVGVPVRVSP